MSEGLGPGSIFAGCRLEGIAGRGGMGVVFRATQLALQRPVALKAIAPELAADEAYRERFQRESHLAASIDHPNVIPVYEAGERDGTLYLIMRWVDGTDLRRLLSTSGRIAPARAIRLLRPVATALAAAHRRGLVHRVRPCDDEVPAALRASESGRGGREEAVPCHEGDRVGVIEVVGDLVGGEQDVERHHGGGGVVGAEEAMVNWGTLGTRSATCWPRSMPRARSPPANRRAYRSTAS